MADGQVLIDSKLNTAGVEKGTKELKEEFQDLAKVTSKVSKAMEKELTGAGEAAEDTADSFGKLFKANLSADLVTDALKNMGEAAVDLAKEAVTAAAEINASNAQFKQTFKGVEKVAKESLNAVAKQAGITATRMQDSYTAIFAFSKSVGADQSQALDISARAMAAAADSAAYYDKSIEEATETLLSFVKGNYENDAALGIAATETTRNAMANKLYAKSFNELSEAQKVDTLLAMVEAGNQASGALGQAAREADSWTNVMGELQEAWRLLLGVLGDPLLKELVPIIKDITASLQELIDKTASAELTEGMEAFRESISGIDEEFKTSSETIEKNAVLADYYRQKLETLEREGFAPASVASREYAHAVEALNGIYPGLNLQIDEHTGLITADTRANLSNLESMKERAFFAAQEERLTEAVKAQVAAKESLAAAEQQLFDIQDQRNMLQTQLAMSDEELAWAMEHRILAAADLTYAETQLLDQAIALNKEEQSLRQTYDEGKAAVAEYEAQIEQISESVKAWGEQHSESAAQVAESTEAAVAQTGEAVVKKNEETLTQIENNTTAAVDTITQTAADAANQFDSEFAEPTQESASATGEVISESFSSSADTMQESWQGKAQWFESNVESPIKTSIENVRSTALSAWSSIESEQAAAWERMVQNVNSAITQMQNKINSLQGKTVNVTVNQTGSYKGASYNGAAYTPSVASTGIPYLASGAVIPPRAPFMAVLGDQPSGLNIEAPLDTIKQAVAEVVTSEGREVNVNISFSGDLAQLGRVLQPVIETETKRIGPSLANSMILE